MVATYRGGVVVRSELEAFAAASPAADTGRKTESTADPRVRAITEIAVRKVLVAEAPARDQGLKASIRRAREEVLTAAAERTLGAERLTASDEELRAYYQAHPEQFHDPERLRLQHIYLRSEEAESSPEQRAAVRARLEEIRRQILDGADFSAMARRHSESADADSGGWTGLKPGVQVFPVFAEAAWSLPLNRVSEVVDTPNGYHLIMVRERIAPIDRPFENVVQFVRQQVLADKRRQLQLDFVRSVGPRYGLVTRHERLDDPLIAGDEPLVEIGAFRLTFDDLVEQLPQKYSEHLFNRFFPQVYQFLDQVELNRLLLLEAERQGLARQEEVIRQVRTAADEAKLAFSLRRRLDQKMAAVPQDELRKFFWQNEKRYQTLRITDLSVMFLTSHGRKLFETLKQAEALAARVRNGEDFARLARTYSRHYSAAAGGKMAELTEYDIAARVQSTAKFRGRLERLAVGEVSAPMVAECYDPDHLKFVPTGVIFVRKDREVPPQPRTFEEVEILVRKNYLRRHFTRLEAEVKREIVDGIDLRVRFDKLPPL